MKSKNLFCILALLLMANAQADDKNVMMFNQDVSNYTATHTDAQMNREGLLTYLDSVIAGGKVTHFLININCQVAAYDSKVMSPMWYRINDPAFKQLDWVRRTHMMHTNGIDYAKVWIDGCRAKNVAPWLSIRMNDVHCVNDRQDPTTSEFWCKHPEFWRVPNSSCKNWLDGAFDYTHPEVRTYFLNFLREALTRYDVDGIECDWMRFTEHLPPGRQRECSWALNEFMRETRKIVNEISAKRGHPIEIAARVASTPKAMFAYGTDALAWAKDGSVDWVIPCNFFSSVDFDMPYAEWKRIIAEANPKVKVLPGMDAGVLVKDAETGNCSRRLLKIEEYCGFADRMFTQGADGIYLFNLFTYFEAAYNNDDRKPWKFILSKGLSPASIKDVTKSIPANWCRER